MTSLEELAMFKFDEELAHDELRKPKVAVDHVSCPRQPVKHAPKTRAGKPKRIQAMIGKNTTARRQVRQDWRAEK